MMDDTEAVEPAHAEDRDRAADHGLAFPHLTALLTANGHRPEEAAEIVRVAQRSWSENAN